MLAETTGLWRVEAHILYIEANQADLKHTFDCELRDGVDDCGS
jgi:hypothetical protein